MALPPSIATFLPIFVVFASVIYPLILAARPSSLVQHFVNVVEEMVVILDSRSHLPDNLQYSRLRHQSCILARSLCFANHTFSWSDHHSWGLYLSRVVKVIRDLLNSQRRFLVLQKDIEEAILAIEEERLRAEAEIARQCNGTATL
ncbi:uncharacterized protein EV420DRAFT_1643994 [Desarmillaria tabescens]|uniref:Uncharacterized protein n=1 Tax=Armillaria tabescens TaxID=1929756 RepID=A0AA39N446_ARMTA|nr:uncharacterized protein EV420DRAFT_1643994 [Desarmillaria tabescens]KAK0457247.1 hypothetical protein EV420DRAFT_1643994 [Desarmillaria tabescens]